MASGKGRPAAKLNPTATETRAGGPHREVYPAGDDDQGHAEGHEAHLTKKRDVLSRLPTVKRTAGREQGHHYHQNDQHPQQDHFPGELMRRRTAVAALMPYPPTAAGARRR